MRPLVRRLIVACLCVMTWSVAASARQKATDPELSAVLDRAATCLSTYVPLFSAFTAEERYEQHFTRRPEIVSTIGVSPASRRTLRSDVVLARVPTGLVAFRDVFDIDGKAVHDNDNRLPQLFLKDPTTATVAAREFDAHAAALNIGDIFWLWNEPTFPLRFLERTEQDRLAFDRRGEETVAGVRASRVDYRETAVPTFLTAPDNANAFASGTVWLDSRTGRVVKTLLKISQSHTPHFLRFEATVLYRAADAPDDAWFPAEMHVRYESDLGTTTGDATYSTFRRCDRNTRTSVPR